MRYGLMVVAAGLLAASAGAQDTVPVAPDTTAASQPAKTQELDLSHAGLRLAWEGNWRWATSDRPICLAIAQSVDRKPWAAVLLYATRQNLRLAKDADKQVALAMAKAFGQRLGEGGELTTPAESAVQVGDASGARATAVAKRPDTPAETFAVTVWQVRDPDSKQLMQYALEVHIGGEAVDDATRLSNELLAGLKSVPLVQASQVEPGPLAQPTVLKAEGVSLCLPANWSLLRRGRRDGTDEVLTAIVSDYLPGMTPHLNLSVIETPLGGDERFDTQQYADQVAKALETQGAKYGWTRVEAGVAKFGGKAGVQVVGKAKARNRSVVQLQRQVHTQDRIYALSITMPGEDPASAKAVMDAVAKSATFVTPQPAPKDGSSE